jgi:hypothetical protein
VLLEPVRAGERLLDLGEILNSTSKGGTPVVFPQFRFKRECSKRNLKVLERIETEGMGSTSYLDANCIFFIFFCGLLALNTGLFGKISTAGL